MAVVSETLATCRRRHEQKFRIIAADGSIFHILSRAFLDVDMSGKPRTLRGIDIKIGKELAITQQEIEQIPTPSSARNLQIEKTPLLSWGESLLVSHFAKQSEQLSADVIQSKSLLFQRAINASDDQMAMLDWDGHIISINSAWNQFSDNNDGTVGSVGVGMNYLDVCKRASVHDEYAHQAFEGIRTVLDGQAEKFSLVYPCHSTTDLRWFSMMVAPLYINGRGGVIVTHRNITGFRKTELTLRAIFDCVRIGIVLISPEGKWLEANAELIRMSGFSSEELLDLCWQIVRPEDRDALRLFMDVMRQSDIDTARQEICLTNKEGKAVWTMATLHCSRNPDKSIASFVASLKDISQAKEAEVHQNLLLQEIAHRGKNMLSVISAIARKSLTSERTMDEARDILTSRIQALAKTYETLTNKFFEGYLLEDLLQSELTSFGARVSIDGSAIRLNAKATQAMALVVHELATNAGKYGALSCPEGRLNISWKIVGKDSTTKSIEFSWVERNGPPVKPPSRKGFGTTLISAVAGAEFDCAPQMHYHTDGFQYHFTAPLSGVGSIVADSKVRRRLNSVVARAIYDAWMTQRPAHGFPSLSNFAWNRFAPTGVLTVANHDENGHIRFLQIGRALGLRLRPDASNVLDDVSYEFNELSRIYNRCLTLGEPCHEKMRIDFGDEDPFTFERLLLPFSSTNQTVASHVIGIVVLEGKTDVLD